MDEITRRAYKSVGKNPPKEGDMTNGDYMHLSHEERMFFNGYFKGASEQDPISRTDEREKCIEKACKFIHDICDNKIETNWKYDLVEKFKEYMK